MTSNCESLTPNRDFLAAQLRSGENPHLPTLTPAGKRDAEFCAFLLLHGGTLPLWAVEG